MSKDNEHSNEPVRLALVGLGGHGQTIQTAAERVAHVQVQAVFDVDGTEAEAAARRFDCKAAPSYEAVLARDDLDAVSLATPNALHRAQAEAAFAAGLHVFVEKPIANTVSDGLAMIEASEAAGRVLMVGHNMRFSRPAQRARQALREGALGEIVTVEIHFSADNTRRMPADAWRLRPEECPLLPVMQLGIHAIDLSHFLLARPIEEVHAYTRSVTTQPGVIDSVVGSFRMDSGVQGTLVSNYCTQVLFEYRIAGTRGSLHCTPHRYWFRRADDTDGHGDGPADIRDFTVFDQESYMLQLKAFADAVRQRETPAADGWAAVQALAVVEALDQSAAAGAPQPVRTFQKQLST